MYGVFVKRPVGALIRDIRSCGVLLADVEDFLAGARRIASREDDEWDDDEESFHLFSICFNNFFISFGNILCADASSHLPISQAMH